MASKISSDVTGTYDEKHTSLTLSKRKPLSEDYLFHLKQLLVRKKKLNSKKYIVSDDVLTTMQMFRDIVKHSIVMMYPAELSVLTAEDSESTNILYPFLIQSHEQGNL